MDQSNDNSLEDADADRAEATLHEIMTYMQGSCHVFAEAFMMRHGGAPVIILDLDEVCYESPDGDDDIYSVLHVLVRLGDAVYDVTGEMECSALREWAEEKYHDAGDIEIDWYGSLETYVEKNRDHPDFDESVDPHRPLNAYDVEDLEAALAVVDRIFPASYFDLTDVRLPGL